MLIPDDNTKDLADIPQNIKDSLEIKPVKWIDEVLQVALKHMPAPIAAAAERVAHQRQAARRDASRSARRSRFGRIDTEP